MDKALQLSLVGMTVQSANYIPDNHRPWKERSHSNPHWQLVLVQGRDLHFQRSTTRLLLHHGHVLLLHPNEIHSSWSREVTDSGFYYAQFFMEAQGTAVAELMKIRLPTLASYPDSDVFDLFSELVDESQKRPKYYRVRGTALLTEILVRVAQHATPLDAASQPVHVRSPREAKIVDELKQFLEAHYRERLTSDVISSHLGYNYSYLSRLFSRATHMTITDYIHYLRIEEARVLLLEMNAYQSIADVAAYVGYSDPSYFGRVFRKMEGVSPSTYIRNAYGRINSHLDKTRVSERSSPRTSATPRVAATQG